MYTVTVDFIFSSVKVTYEELPMGALFILGAEGFFCAKRATIFQKTLAGAQPFGNLPKRVYPLHPTTEVHPRQ